MNAQQPQQGEADLSFTAEKGEPAQPLPYTALMQSRPLPCILRLFVNPLDSYANALIYLEIKTEPQKKEPYPTISQTQVSRQPLLNIPLVRQSQALNI